jgi:hypothetical protein
LHETLALEAPLGLIIGIDQLVAAPENPRHRLLIMLLNGGYECATRLL